MTNPLGESGGCWQEEFCAEVCRDKVKRLMEHHPGPYPEGFWEGMAWDMFLRTILFEGMRSSIGMAMLRTNMSRAQIEAEVVADATRMLQDAYDILRRES